VTELKRQNGSARPGAGRAFLKRRQLALPGWPTQLVFWSLVVAGLALDLWSKSVVFGWLEQKPGNSVSIIDGFLRLVMALNQGAAFGIATGKHQLLAAVSFVALIVIVVVFLFSGSRSKVVHVALALFGAGICGNLWDRLFNHGQVRDFIDVYYRDYHWPAFNLADSMLCIGVGLLVLSSFWVSKRPA
jgi:signal peptidase II